MKNKIKILYISHSPYLNGAEISLFTLLNNIDRNIFEPIVVFPYHGPLTEKIKNLGIKVYIAALERWIRYNYDKPLKNLDIISRSEGIIKIIEDESIDIVHTNTSVVLEGAIAARRKNIPHIWHIHENLKKYTDLKSSIPLPLVYWIMSFLSESIVSVSHFAVKQFEPIVDDKKIMTIYNGVEENLIMPNDLLRINLGVQKNELFAITVGFLTETKGFANLLEAAAVVRQKGYPVRFIWVGDTSRRALHAFNRKIKRLNLKGSVIYLGFREDIISILKCSDFVICPSFNESLPLSIIEAMAAGKSVISTNWGGVSECVIDGETGFIVPINDPIKLSEKIIELCEDKKKRKKFGENALKYFTENFRASVYAEKFEKLYMRILNNRSFEPISEKERMLIDSFLQVYKIISDNHWKILKKGK